MERLIEKINKIPKGYFSFADLRKISSLDDESLRVTVSRLVKSGKIAGLVKGIYSADLSKVSWERFAVENYAPSYLSFEWALGYFDILSQKTYSLTLATTRQTKKTITPMGEIFYRHIKPELFWGSKKEAGFLIAEPEKAFLDLAYLSLNGYAKFDPAEMNLSLLNKKKIKIYLKKINSKRLFSLINNLSL
jgi:predicted transcriptional regulator of viral defense system